MLSFIALAAVYLLVSIQHERERRYIGILSDQQVLSQQLANTALAAIHGESDAFARLRDSRDRFERQLEMLHKGDDEKGLPIFPAPLGAQLALVNDAWSDVDKALDTILRHEQSITDVRASVASINDKSGQLLAYSDEVATLTAQAGASRQQIYVATRQMMFSQRIVGNVNRILEGGEESMIAADRLGRDATLFDRMLKGLMEGDLKDENNDPAKRTETPGMQIERIPPGEAKEKLEKVNGIFNEIQLHAGEILRRSPVMFEAWDALSEMRRANSTLQKTLNELSFSYQDYVSSGVGRSIYGVFADARL